MNKNVVGICMILIVGLVISLVSAGLMGYYGRVVQEVRVEGLVFYANIGDELLINNDSGNGHYQDVDFANSKTYYTSELSEPLDFYKPHIEFQVRANITSGINPNNLNLIFGYFDSLNNKNIICNSSVEINGDYYNEYTTSCEGTSELSGIKQFYYEIRGDEGSEYRISTKNSKTKIEVSPA